MSGIALDPRTLVFVLTMARAIEAAVFLYAWRVHRRYPPIGFWALGATAYAIGIFLVGLRGIIPPVWSIILGNALLFFGVLEFNVGIVSACDRKPPVRTGFALLALTLIAFLWFTFVDENTPLRILLYAITTAVYSTYSIFILLSSLQGPLAGTRGLIAVALAIETGVSGYRGLDSYLHNVAGVLQSTPMQVVFFMALIAQVVVMTFACTLLTSQRLQIELERSARHDPLTDLWNRRAFFELVEREWSHSAREGEPFSALMIDVDRFKGLNDRYGHAAGDAVLQAVALALSRELRPRDILGRYGGEEFAVILPATNTELALSIGERLRCAIEALPIAELDDVPVTVSIGVARGLAPGTPITTVLAEADRALYLAKETGRNRVVVA